MHATDKELFRINNFDLIRLLAALQVVLIHTVEHLQIEAPFTDSILNVVKYFPGVPIFFVLSGFLISRSFESNSNIVDYTWNRAIRIFPALWVCFVISVLSVLLNGYHPAYAFTQITTWTVAQLTFLQFYNPSFMRGYGTGVLNGSLWTIPVELQFYALTPIIYWTLGLLKKKQNALLIGTTALFFAVRIAIESHSFATPITEKLVIASFLPHVCMFLLGAALQRNLLLLKRIFVGTGIHWLLAYAVLTPLLASMGLDCTGNHLNTVSVLLLAGVTISCGFTMPSASERILGRNDISYGIYIYHMPVVNFLVFRNWTHNPLFLGVVLGVSFLLATASWKFIERPALRYKRRSLRKLTGNTEPVSASTRTFNAISGG